ncbi:staphylokinase domain-containing protein [Streptococcus phocae subsp. salmonis]
MHIRFIDYDINSSILQKEALLEAVQYQMLQTDLDGKRYRVIDFDTDARLTDRYGKLYKADADGSVNLGKNDIQEYLLTGHVVLEEMTELTPDQLKNPAADVNMYYNVQFSSMEDENPFLSEEVDLGRVPVGTTFTSSDLKEKAQQLLEKKYPGYAILDRLAAKVVHDNKDYTFLHYGQYSYTVKHREFIPVTQSHQNSMIENDNSDLISEVYTVVRKDKFAEKAKSEIIDVRYIDASNDRVLVQTSLLIRHEEDIDFTDGYDPLTKNRILFNNLDPYNISNYTITGRVDQYNDNGTRNVDVYMITRPSDMRAGDHYGYDNGYSYDEMQEYAYLRELVAPK